MLISTIQADEVLGGGGDEWAPDWGSPLVHRHVLPLAMPGDRVLDLCCGFGRASYPLGLKGCAIVGLDSNADGLEYMQTVADNFGFPFLPIEGDARELTTLFPRTRFDIVLAMDALVHQNKCDAYEIIRQAASLLREGGMIYVDGPSTSNYEYTAMQKTRECIDRDTFLDMCGCSGVPQLEPFCFFHPGELAVLLCGEGLKVVHHYSDWFEYRTYRTVCIAKR